MSHDALNVSSSGPVISCPDKALALLQLARSQEQAKIETSALAELNRFLQELGLSKPIDLSSVLSLVLENNDHGLISILLDPRFDVSLFVKVEIELI
jgi:hypothetical protein